MDILVLAVAFDCDSSHIFPVQCGGPTQREARLEVQTNRLRLYHIGCSYAKVNVALEEDGARLSCTCARGVVTVSRQAFESALRDVVFEKRWRYIHHTVLEEPSLLILPLQ